MAKNFISWDSNWNAMNFLKLDCFSARSLKHPRHIISIFALVPKKSVLSREAENTNLIVFGLTVWTNDLAHSRWEHYDDS